MRFRTRKHLALLVRLAVEPGRPLTRDHLIDLLWADAPAPHARHSLAQAISVLRTKLGREHVLVQKATVALDDVVDVDVAHLDACDAAVGGPFLEGFDIPRARVFEDWKDAMRARLLPRMRDCLVRQMDGSRRLGDFAGVERHAQVLLDLDPHSEDAVRGLMEARAWVGDRSNALKVYGRFELRLREDLGAKPSAQLARVAHLLREGRAAARPASPDEPAPKPEKPFRAEHLVGREREFSVLYDAWLAVRRREPRIVVVSGDPGIGKTTLTNAFAATCQMEGAVVARAQAYDGERDLPFAVLAELVRQLTEQRAIGAADPEALSELTRVCADIYRAFPGVPHPAEWSAEVTPLRLAQAFWRTVEAAAEESPLVLVVDDIHAADTASTAILHSVARKLTSVRLLMVLTGHTGDLRTAPAAALVADGGVTALRPLELDPLPPAESERLLREVVAEGGGSLPESAAARMLRASRGNPLALALLAGEWRTHSGASLVEDLDRLNTQPSGTIGIPRAIGTVFERQRQRLPAEAAGALNLAAVLGRRLAELALYEAAGLGAGTATAALTRLREEGILREVQGALEFRNELLRAQAYYAVPAPARRQLHRRVGELLCPTAEQGGEAALLETAWHFLRGGDEERGRSFGLRGAEAALAVGAPREAEQMLEALAVHKVEPDEWRKIRLLLADALLSQSKAHAALHVVEELQGQAALSPSEAAQACRLRATTEYFLARDEGATYSSAADESLRQARHCNDPRVLARALFEFARSGVEGGYTTRVRQSENQLTDLLETADGQTAAAVHYARAYCCFHLGDVAEAARSLNKALEVFASAPNPVEQSKTLTGLLACHLLNCETEKALETGNHALALARRVGDESRQSILLGNLASVHLVRGEYQSALELGIQSIQLAREASVQPFLLSSLFTALFACTMLDRPRDAEQWFAQATDWIQGRRSWRLQVLYFVEAAEWELAKGNLGKALGYFQGAFSRATDREELVPLEGHYHLLRMLAISQAGEHRQALQYIQDKVNYLRARSPLACLTAASGQAAIEIVVHGTVSRESTELLADPRWEAIAGRRGLLQAEGLTPGATVGSWNVCLLDRLDRSALWAPERRPLP